jgi:magnesium chelatase family protein
VVRCAAQYQARLSGPLLDRFDLTLDVGAVTAADLMRPPPAEGSREVAERVAAARAIQVERYRDLGLDAVGCNAAAPASVIEEVAAPEAAAATLMREAADRMRLSARGYHRVLKLARTLADLDGGGPVQRLHFAEALSYRGVAERAAAAA